MATTTPTEPAPAQQPAPLPKKHFTDRVVTKGDPKPEDNPKSVAATWTPAEKKVLLEMGASVHPNLAALSSPCYSIEKVARDRYRLTNFEKTIGTESSLGRAIAWYGIALASEGLSIVQMPQLLTEAEQQEEALSGRR